MKTKQIYNYLSPDEKIKLIGRAIGGESITKICKENSISRTILYRWLKEYKHSKENKTLDALAIKHPSGRRHWRKLSLIKERKIINLWLANPDYSIRKIAKNTGVSIGSVWNIVKGYERKVEVRGGKSLKRHKKKSYKYFSNSEKIELITRHQKGENIAKIAREKGISRTIFYRWQKAYENQKKDSKVLEHKRPRGEEHWRFIPGISDLVLKIVSEHPEYSLSKLQSSVLREDVGISRTGLYYILKRLELTTPLKRIAYAKLGPPSLPVDQQSVAIDRMSNLLIYSFIFFFGWIILMYSIPNYLRVIVPGGDSPFITQKDPDKRPDDPIFWDANQFSPERDHEQGLGWGALAINTTKSLYKKDEDVKVGLGVVDSRGQTICDADLRAGIGLLPEEINIIQSGECGLQTVTNTPDYIATLSASFQKNGTYEIDINARTYEGARSFSDKLIIVNSIPFDIERSSYPTRIFPDAYYPVEITIKPEQDFTGEISDSLPSGIKATNISSNGIAFNNPKNKTALIRWSVNLKKGNTYKLSYNLHFPAVYPAFYELGPFRFVDSRTNKLVFQEARYWQIVADALN